MLDSEKRIRKFIRILIGYPIALIIIALVLNMFVFGVEPLLVALPAPSVLTALIISAILLLINHSWLMTTTELTRLNYKMYASQEEWDEAGVRKEDVSSKVGLSSIDVTMHIVMPLRIRFILQCLLL